MAARFVELMRLGGGDPPGFFESTGPIPKRNHHRYGSPTLAIGLLAASFGILLSLSDPRWRPASPGSFMVGFGGVIVTLGLLIRSAEAGIVPPYIRVDASGIATARGEPPWKWSDLSSIGQDGRF